MLFFVQHNSMLELTNLIVRVRFVTFDKHTFEFFRVHQPVWELEGVNI